MGVHGLWKLIEPSGKPVPLETLENKVLAVDVSIWLHQAIKGFQDSRGASVPNAHLLGIYHRICKLLYYKIKPVFVFDGGVPALKKQTIAKRNEIKSRNITDASRLQKQILSALLKHTAVTKVLSEKTKANLPVKVSPTKRKDIVDDDEDLFKLPFSQADSTISSSDEDYETETSYSSSSPTKHWDLHSIDERSAEFKALPADVRHEILTELKETRKQSSWGRIHELPTQSDDFSGYQMKRLLKRFSVQASLEEAEKEMGGHSLSLGELEALLNDHGVITKESLGQRIASDENTRYLYIKDVKNSLEKARLEQLRLDTIKESEESITEEVKINEVGGNAKEIEVKEPVLENDQEYQRDLERAIQLSLQNEPSTSKASNSFLDFLDESINESTIVEDKISPSQMKTFAAAKTYMMEYSGLTLNGINDILNSGTGQKKVSKINFGKLKGDVAIEQSDKTQLEENSGNEIEQASNLESDLPIENSRKGDTLNSDEKEEEGKEREFCILSGTEEILKPDKNKANEHSINEMETLKKVASSTSTELSENSITKIKTANQSNNLEIENLKEIKSSKYFESAKAVLIKHIDSDATKPVNLNQHTVKQLSIQRAIDLEAAEKSSTFEDPDKISYMSDSESSDLVEVSDSDSKEKHDELKNGYEIVVNPAEKLDDDLFGDIFTKQVEVENKPVALVEPPPSISRVVDSNDVLEPFTEDNITEPVLVTEDKVIMEPSPILDKKVVTEDNLREMQNNLSAEKRELISERSTKERLAANITDQMYQETQELLQLFGVPYIIAPMEAEAQCAFLNEANLTDGTITDDSDIWLFGGKTVYKNFFNQSKRVLEYKAENIEYHFKLSRRQMILLALLVGSDYTVGIQGVGPVTALEILAAFPIITKADDTTSTYFDIASGLTEFRRWLKEGKIAGPGKAALRNKLRNVVFGDSFPNMNVIRAYLEPEVESSKEKFSWGIPDIAELSTYSRKKFGWTEKKSEEILNPVVKRMRETRVQSTIKDYFKTNHKIDSSDITERMSKRVKKAVKKIGSGGGNASSDEDIKVLKQTRKVSRKKVKEIDEAVKSEVDNKKRRPNIPKKEVIPQKLKTQSEIMKNKLKAIEVFRKSTQGPGYVKKRKVVVRQPKEDAELSESSSD